MAWSIFTQGGGPGAAVTWAEDLLAAIGAPDTPGNEQMVYDWELSEGGGGQFNPLNQGPDPNHPNWSTGSQFGGGAAGYDSWQHGLIGSVDYLNMPNFVAIRDALKSNNPAAARSALWASPWASSHYGYGKAWNSGAVPNTEIPLPITPGGSSPPGGTQTTSIWSLFDPAAWLGVLEQAFASGVADLESSLLRVAVTAAVVLAGAGLIAFGAYKAATGKNLGTEVKEQLPAPPSPAQAAQALPLAAAAV